MVNNVNAWITSPPSFASREVANGGNDMELGWNTYAHTSTWTTSYNSAASYGYYDFGDCAGCPSTDTYATTQPPPGRNIYAQDGSGGTITWTQELLDTIAWELPAAFPLPEIYVNPPPGDPTQAKQWEDVSLYNAKNYGYPLYFEGELTEWKDLVDTGKCPKDITQPCIENRPFEGWTELYNALQTDAHTAQRPNSSLDISHK